MIMDVRAINMCCYDKGVFSFCPAQRSFISYSVSFFRSNLSWFKRLTYLIGNNIIFLLPARDMLVLPLRQKKLLISCFRITFIRTDILSIIRLCCILRIICTVCQTLCHRFPFVYMKGNQSCCRHFLTVLLKK